MKRPHRRAAPLLAALLLAACAGDGDGEGAGPSDVAADAEDDAYTSPGPLTVDELAAPGPWGVGFRTFEVTYTPETFEGERTLPVSVWYPTTDTAGEAAAYLNGIIERPDVFVDASLAGDGVLPLLVFSHGNGGVPGQSWFYTEHLATHGWVVVAPAHTGNTAFDLDSDRVDEMFILRPLDVTAVLDAVYGLDASDPLAGRLGEDVALAGHSFGGYTSFAVGGASYDVAYLEAACEAEGGQVCDALTPERFALLEEGFLDARVDAIVPMAPAGHGVFDPLGPAAIDVPALVFTGAMDATTTNAGQGDPLWQALDGPDDLRVDIATAGHYTFSNACEMGLSVDDGCGDGFIPFEDGFEIIRVYSLAFLRRHLLGDERAAPVLRGEVAVSDEVALDGPDVREDR